MASLKYHLTVRQQITDILSNLLSRLNRMEPLPVISIFAVYLASSAQKDIDLQALLQFTSLLFRQWQNDRVVHSVLPPNQV